MKFSIAKPFLYLLDVPDTPKARKEFYAWWKALGYGYIFCLFLAPFFLYLSKVALALMGVFMEATPLESWLVCCCAWTVLMVFGALASCGAAEQQQIREAESKAKWEKIEAERRARAEYAMQKVLERRKRMKSEEQKAAELAQKHLELHKRTTERGELKQEQRRQRQASPKPVPQTVNVKPEPVPEPRPSKPRTKTRRSLKKSPA